MTSLNIQKNIPLAPFTTFKIGGPASFFVEVKDETELLEALDYAKEKGLEIFMLGGGSNVLFSDNGFDGLVIRMQESKEDKYWAGNSLAGLVNFFKENSFTGLEWAMGIPGTIGGAVRGNAGAYGGQMADNLESVRALEISADRSNIREYEKKDCEFGYRDSLFKKNKKIIVLSVKLRLERGRKEAIAEKMQETITKRNVVVPKGLSAGSFFQNPTVENLELRRKFEKDTGAKVQDGKVPAGWLIEEVGFCEKKIGGIVVSGKHANFFINDGTGTAEDVITLSSMIKQKLRKEFDVQIKEEVMYVGF
ncbi:MAG: UDP-N-acetylmuramate dehydrogenase [Candidatus Moraniibacteriota bacterium]